MAGDGGSQHYELRFSHHVIEHLGLKLYQNKPTNVVAELVSNAWDAGATKVDITVSDNEDRAKRFLAVADNGSGMTPQGLAEDYLVIGKPKKRPRAARYSMGRKGIGKLAPFGIANAIDIVTVTETSATWLRLRLEKLLADGAASSPTELASSEPDIIFEGERASDLPVDQDITGSVAQFLSLIEGKTGTLVLLSDLSVLRAISAKSLLESMGRRFTVTLNRDDFAVEVNGDLVGAEQSLPEFEFRIPKEGFVTEQIGGKDVRYWAGFVQTAAWPSDEAGVGVYAHGKIAQDRPFTFGVRGREIFTRYMYAVVEADFLDELPEDVISTDRSSIDWDNPIARQLYEWGQKSLRRWIEDYRDHKATGEKRRILALVDDRIERGELPKIRDDEKEMLSDLLAEVTPSLGKQEGADVIVTSAVLKAYLHRPTRELLKKLWGSYSAEGSQDAYTFLNIVDRLAQAAVPEALSIAVTFAQRAYALSCLMDFQHSRGEPELQKLIERFPWILQPGFEKLTANQQLRTVVMEAAKRGLSPSRFDTSEVVDEETKPDFVFLSNLDQGHIVVVEIKTPREDLTLSNREQLASYMTYLEQQYPQSKREGILVGSNSSNLDPVRRDIRIMSWSDVFVESRRGHIDMLAAMLRTANPDPDDARLQQVLEFGGDAVWELLEKVGANDEELSELLQNRPKLT
ncbi:MAG: DUF4263 domain-containing protein [Novosphingobium sp.]|nr:DUF4263 domain-containing protein [Novosphingobium sp.]MBO9603090.1 DUF4263 domain-containing protein [Novosphingobium sp.]